jgi:hypothetical protein
MNLKRIAFAIALFLCVTAVAYSQEPGAEPKPPKQEEHPKMEEPKAPRPEEAKPPKSEKQESPKMQGEKEESKPAHEEKDHQGHARPAGKSAHIPDPKFKANFGHQHTFAVKQVIHETRVVPGQTQFVYGGYSFIIVDPWPSVWLYSDDCYIDYVDDDYFLFDVMHPGIRVALFVVG